MRMVLAVAVLLAMAGTAGAESDPRLARAKLQAKQNGQAIVRKQFLRVAELTYPKIVQELGGPQEFAKKLARGSEQMAAQGVSYRLVTVRTPEKAVATPGGLMTVVPMTVEMNVPGGRLKKKSFLIGVSDDDGRTWTFVDGANINPKNLTLVLPHFPVGELALPAPEKAVFRKSEDAEPEADPADEPVEAAAP